MQSFDDLGFSQKKEQYKKRIVPFSLQFLKPKRLFSRSLLETVGAEATPFEISRNPSKAKKQFS
ncbi:hypothetical protein CJZ72_01100 [Enterococcus durans]|nr:hypothetical protein CJZ72_01100 [Enterococcus durans]